MDGHREGIARNHARYRLASTPLLLMDAEVYWGDVIEADVLEDGSLVFRRIVEHAPLYHVEYILHRKVVESAAFAALLQKIESCGGAYEIFMGGVFRCHLPETCVLNIDEQLKKVHQVVIHSSEET